ncbi:MAG: ABC transporter substrate-binding protein [bacterium]|nr:ABC transporter substrate-binding protein [bacterium]
MKKRKLASMIVCISMIGTMLMGCQKKEEATTTSQTTPLGAAATTDKKDNVIRIGVVSSLTGGSAIYGEGAQNSITMAAEEINSSDSAYKVEIVNGGKVVDDAGDSKQAVNAYNSLEAEKPDAVVGAFFSSVTLPMAEIAKGQNMLLLATGATNYKVTQVGPTIFRDCFIDPYQGKMAAAFAKDQGAKKAAIIYAKDDDYSNGLKDAFVENAKTAGIEIVYTGECTTKDTDFSAQASQVVASGADFLFYPCFLDTVPLFVQQARGAGYEGVIMGGDGWDGADTTGLETDFEKCYFTNHYSSEDTAPAVQQFVTKYKEKYGEKSLNACAALYYDAIYMLVEAAKNGGGSDTASLVKGMTGMKFTGVGGTFTLDKNGDPAKSVVVNTYENGKVKWFKTIEPESN